MFQKRTWIYNYEFYKTIHWSFSKINEKIINNEYQPSFYNYRTLVGFFAAVYTHVDEQFVSGIERSGTRTTLPKTSEFVLWNVWGRRAHGVFVFFLFFFAISVRPSSRTVRIGGRRFNVTSFNVTNQALLIVENETTIAPTTGVGRRISFLGGHIAPCKMKNACTIIHYFH